MESKVCTNCGLEKNMCDFGPRKDSKDGLQSQCKVCKNKSSKEYKERNKDKIKIYRENGKDKMKIYRETNKEKIKDQNTKWYLENKEKSLERSKNWAKNNREKANQISLNSNKKRRAEDPIFKFKEKTRSNINKAIKRNCFTKNSSTTEILGCSYDDFILYIESLWLPWMNWDNRGLYNGTPNYGWDIDHIEPLSTANSIEDIIKLNHYTNLQPLCSYINRDVKIDKVDP